jgi:hypothetical protein
VNFHLLHQDECTGSVRSENPKSLWTGRIALPPIGRLTRRHAYNVALQTVEAIACLEGLMWDAFVGQAWVSGALIRPPRFDSRPPVGDLRR